MFLVFLLIYILPLFASYLDQVSRLLLASDHLPRLGHRGARHRGQLLESVQHQLRRPLLAHLKYCADIKQFENDSQRAFKAFRTLLVQSRQAYNNKYVSLI